MANIFKIILTTIRIIYRVIRIPFGFGFIILGILFSAGLIDDPVAGSEINYFMMILNGREDFI